MVKKIILILTFLVVLFPLLSASDLIQVECPETFSITSGEQKNVGFSIQNNGFNNVAFTYWIECDKGSQTLSPVPPQSIKVGELIEVTGRFGLTVSPQKEQDVALCTFFTEDINTLEQESCTFAYSSKIDTGENKGDFNIGVTYQPNMVCSPNSITCKDSNTLKTCNSDGTGFTLINCQDRCLVLENGEARCILGQGGNNPKTPFLYVVIIALVVVIFLLIFLKKNK